MTNDHPLILTATLNSEAQYFFDEQRNKYFPQDKNFLSAHLTLFHHLPPREPLIQEAVMAGCDTQKTIAVRIAGLVFIGRGVAYKIESTELQSMHKLLRQRWLPFLTAQDRQGLWPHVTVQNKVAAAEAKALYLQLRQRFTPFDACINGLALWEYLDGPWRLLKQYYFENKA